VATGMIRLNWRGNRYPQFWSCMVDKIRLCLSVKRDTPEII